eukprot:1932262-Pleurochrysis_carterae.AAC.3
MQTPRHELGGGAFEAKASAHDRSSRLSLVALQCMAAVMGPGPCGASESNVREHAERGCSFGDSCMGFD